MMIRKYFSPKENANTTYQNLQDAGKVLLLGKLMAMNGCIREGSQVTDPPLKKKNKIKL